jgi:hypothetical protein
VTGVLLAWVLACATAGPAPTSTCATTGGEMALPELAEGVLVQYQSTDREGESTGFRVFDDGRYERRRSGGPWEPRPRLSAEALGAIRDAVAATVLPVPAEAPSGPQADDATVGVLQLRAAGRERALVLEAGCRVAEVDALFEVLGPRLP